MKYEEIIKNNCEKYSKIAWWPNYAFHCTDVRNAVSILDLERLFSRQFANLLGVMQNDNASRQVIDMTRSDTTAHVRFYFRPHTPTQYYNEGFKHSALRYDNDPMANMPVPVFFVFDLAKLLKMPGVQFSERGQAGYGSILHQGEEAFEKLNFEKIYDNGFSSKEDLAYRHAEILYPNSFDINTCLKAIVCRNHIERITLLNLLKNKNVKAYKKYSNKIQLRSDMFENNGLFIRDYQYYGNNMSFHFSDTLQKKRYIERMMKKNNVEKLDPVEALIKIYWVKDNEILHMSEVEFQIDYLNQTSVSFIIPDKNADSMLSIVYFEEKEMCVVEQTLVESELV